MMRLAMRVWTRARRTLGTPGLAGLALLVPGALLFLAFMGLQGRYFGRWLLPIFPILCLLAALFERGVALTRACQTALTEAEQKVELLMKRPGAEPQAVDFDASGARGDADDSDPD